MLFNSLQYLLFLPIVLAIYWLSPHRFRLAILLIASYVFYMAWRPAFGLLIFGLTLANFWFGLRIAQSQLKKKAWLIAALTANLATLAFFKYFYFLEDSVMALLRPLTGELPKLPVTIILPLGISFFVFEFIHYVVEVYRGNEPVRKLAPFALFASFFPTQIAGPIKRYQDFIPQLAVPMNLTAEHIDEGCYLIISGLFKKVLLADNLAFFVAGGYAHPGLFTGLDLWVFTFAFSFQIYFDFGGYADIARGSAKLLGFKVPINFDFPFLSSNVSELWRRWHISLGTWLRDYLFFPLGGSRHSKWATARNFLITFSLAGLWHGAASHYVIWGFFNGVCLALHREFSQIRESISWLANLFDTHLGKAFSIFATFFCWCVGLVFFRAEDNVAACSMLQKMFFLNGAHDATYSLQAINYPLIYPSILWLLALITIVHVGIERTRGKVAFSQLPRGLKVAYGSALMLTLIAFAPDNSPRFIYYQF